MLPDDRYPAVSDLRRRAKRRTPFFAYEYLDSGTGLEQAQKLNEDALAQIKLIPRFLKGDLAPTITTKLFGKDYSAPFGVAPIGMTSLMWPGAERILAIMAAKNNIPYCLSTVAGESIETIGSLAGGNGWFQLYSPQRRDVRDDLIKRAKEAGFTTLVVTVDVPVPSMRERQRRAGLTMPPTMNARTLYRVFTRPHWLLETLKRGSPKFLTLEKYASTADMRSVATFVGSQLAGALDWEYLKEIRDQWDGPLVLKGILSVEDAKKSVSAGADGVWVSNHGGRQFDGAPAAIECLAEIVDAVGSDAKILFDSGIRGGVDIIRALRLGADFVFMGRPFVYGVCALGKNGGEHVYSLFSTDLTNNMIQLGCDNLDQILDLEINRYKIDKLNN